MNTQRQPNILLCMPARTSILAGQYTRICAPELGNAIQRYEDDTWGISDCHSWLGAFDGPDDVGPLPWNRSYGPKLAFMAMKQAFVETPPVIRTTLVFCLSKGVQAPIKTTR